MSDSPLEIRSSDGLTLEGEAAEPEHPGGIVVACHPHPKMGGTMNAPLLLDLQGRLVAAGWAVVRFNFRGIGNSAGQSSDGTDEVADAAGAVEAAEQRWPGLPLVVVGWSFGAGVAVRYSIAEGPAACVAIAPPVKGRPGISARLPEPGTWPPEVPLLVISAGRDELVDPADCKAWAEAAGARLHEIPAANHFFWARYDALGEAIVSFLDQVL